MRLKPEDEIEIVEGDIFKNDSFDRECEVKNLSEIIQKVSQSCVIAVNGKWGSGKTTFVRLLAEYLKQSGLITSYFSAWENDFIEEPFLLILNHIIKELSASAKQKKDIKQSAIKVLKAISIHGSKAIVNSVIPKNAQENVKELFEDVTPEITEIVFDSFESQKDEIGKLKKKLDKLIPSNGKMVVIIDELDRCRPSFAIELLERIKHIFNTQKLVFVLATDIKQLSSAISGVYGESYDGREYLERFFDVEYDINEPDYAKYWNRLLENHSGKGDLVTLKHKEIILKYGLWFTNHIGLNARQVNRLYSHVYLATLAPNIDDNLRLIILLCGLKYCSKDSLNKIQSRNISDIEIFKLLKLDIFLDTDNETTFEILYMLLNILSVIKNDSIKNYKKFFLESFNAFLESESKNHTKNIKELISLKLESYCEKLGELFDKEALLSAINVSNLQLKINHKSFVSLSKSYTIKTNSTIPTG